ncbi:unnamed protein product [Caenorhabditis sp. 36 PRJEB53466]|nr:unnamed protein product [Caenorhabditis sp. 36 PRJEB53466]
MKLLFLPFLALLKVLVSGQNLNYDGITGLIYSPNYPKDYDNSANVVFTITVPSGHYIHLTFLDFLTEDSYDYLAVQQGTGDEAEPIQNYSSISGDRTGLSIDITSSEATLVFTSDLTTTFRGFAIRFDSVLTGSEYMPTNTCSSPLHSSEFGIVTSPSFPDNYPNNISCSYLLIAPASHVITLQFVAFNTEDGYDIVYVYDGSNNSYPLVGKYSGKKVPATIYSTGNTLYLFFQSDLVNNFSGFSALYTSAAASNEFRRGVLPQSYTADPTPRRDANILKWLKDKKGAASVGGANSI